MAETVSANHIAAGGNDMRYEPQRKNNFTVRFDLPGGLRPIGQTSVVALSVKAMPFPMETSDILEIPFGNEIRKVAGITKFTNEQLTVHDYVDGNTASVFADWRQKVYNPDNGFIGYAYQYKTEGSLLFFGPDGEQKRLWKLIGMWPMRVKYGAGEMGSSATPNEIEIEFAIDKYIYDGRES